LASRDGRTSLRRCFGPFRRAFFNVVGRDLSEGLVGVAVCAGIEGVQAERAALHLRACLEMTLVYGSRLARRLTNEVGEAVGKAAFDPSEWQAVTEVMRGFVPDSFVAVFNQDATSGGFTVATVDGMERPAFEAFLSHYGGVNPWDAVWAQNPSGHVLVTEREAPVGLYAETEFYRDWFRHLDGFEAGVGTRLVINGADNFYVSFHYPLSLAGEIDPALEAAMRGLQGHFSRAIELNRLLADRNDKLASAAALIDRGGDIGFAVNFDMRLVEMNEAADLAFRRGWPVSARGGVVRLCDDGAGRWMAATVRALLAGGSPPDTKRIVRDGSALWRISLIPVPQPVSAANRFIPFHRVVVVHMHDHGARPQAPDGAMLARAFGLTPAEARLCMELAEGLTVAQAADRLGLARETVRHRLKTVFYKTDTHRQAELVALLLRVR
jgi:DNA-binding CsgD family transcriptional regulator